MSETINDNGDIMLLTLSNFDGETDDTRVFIASKNINIFPCSRRGQIGTKGTMLNYDPEARLNTERTNRLRTAINGFTDSFVDSFTVYKVDKDENGNELETGSLVFVLKGYRVEIKNFKPSDIAAGLGITKGIIYAHLSLHDNIPLGVKDYFTEILYRQTGKSTENNYIDVEYSDDTGKKSDFFMGVSFTKKSASNDYIVDSNNILESADLPLFAKNSDGAWELVQTSKLPKIRHGDTEDSIKIDGNLTITGTNSISTPTLKVNTITSDSAEVKIDKPLKVDSTLDVNSGKATLHKGLNVKNGLAVESGFTLLDSPLEVFGTTTLNNGLEVTAGETKVQELTAAATSVDSLSVDGVTALRGTVAIENDLDVTGITSTPTLKADTISSKSGGALTVDSNVTLNGTMTVSGKTTLDDELVVNNKKATFSKGTSVAEGLTVTSGLTELKQTTTEGLTDTGYTQLKNLAVSGPASITGSLEAGSIQTTGGLTVTGESKLTNVKTAKVTAEALELKDIGQVPALELAHLTETDTYQLRFKFGPIAITEE